MQIGVQLRTVITRTAGAWLLSCPDWATKTEILGDNLPVYLILAPSFFFFHVVSVDDFCY